MDFSQNGLFALMQRKIAYHSQRQTVLAQNVANADTPGYVPRDLEKANFRKMAMESAGGSASAPHVTHPGHMTGHAGGGGRFAVIKQKDAFESTPVGNEVVLEEQMLLMAENKTDFEATTSMYRKMMDMMRLAAGSN